MLLSRLANYRHREFRNLYRTSQFPQQRFGIAAASLDCIHGDDLLTTFRVFEMGPTVFWRANSTSTMRKKRIGDYWRRVWSSPLDCHEVASNSTYSSQPLQRRTEHCLYEPQQCAIYVQFARACEEYSFNFVLLAQMA